MFGEGAGVVVLESLEHAQARGANILVELAGAGWSFDAYDQTAPAPELEAYAMKLAMERGGRQLTDVTYVNAHGTSTRLNDPTETRAVKLAFGDLAYKLAVNSTKSMTGHAITGCRGGRVHRVCHDVGERRHSSHHQLPDSRSSMRPRLRAERGAPGRRGGVCHQQLWSGGENCCLAFRRFKG